MKKLSKEIELKVIEMENIYETKCKVMINVVENSSLFVHNTINYIQANKKEMSLTSLFLIQKFIFIRKIHLSENVFKLF